MERGEAERILQYKFGIEHFYDKQWRVISQLLSGNHRILMIERTGFGKSLCYQFPAILFEGTTIVFSPLIALMRDQVESLISRGIPAACINSSQSEAENTEIIERAEEGKIKILYITPERQENRDWMQSIVEGRIQISMVVIDEAHTISVWGHDFRPAFRKIVKLIKHIGTNTPVLATTATATIRVQKDIQEQMGGQVEVIRGSLIRKNLRLHVIKTKSEYEKMIWLKQHLPNIPGTGIIYAGTRAQSEYYANWLVFLGIDCIFYNAGLDSERREEIEKGLMLNRWKCVISTNALGMGIDKTDIRFIIHLQIPVSPIHYYQEIGRAGRDGKEAKAILLYNDSQASDGIPEDKKLPLSFINGAKPDKKKYLSVISTIREADQSLGEKAIMLNCNLKQTEFRTIKEDLIEQGIIREVMYSKRKEYEATSLDTEPDFREYEEVRRRKISDLDAMIEYTYLRDSHMNFLCNFLGDEEKYSGQDNIDTDKYSLQLSQQDLKLFQNFRENYFPQKSLYIDKNHTVRVVSASYYGITNVGEAIHNCKYGTGGDFPDFLLELSIKAFKKELSKDKYDVITFVPPTVSGDLVSNFSYKIGKRLGIPVANFIKKARDTEEQKYFRNSVGKSNNVKNAFYLEDRLAIKGTNILLIDDIVDSGNSLKEIGKLLFANGAALVAALTIAQTIGNDS